MSLEVGGVLHGKYLLDASIGRGGMGEVFAATDQDGRRVAIKVVRRVGTDALLMARLHREAEAAYRVQSAYVPELFEVDTTDAGELFLVMELLEGETLAQRLRAPERQGVLPWSDVARLGEDVLSGLIDAHAAGVVHRDLKPGNVFLEEDEDGQLRAKILDFGVCKLDRHDGERLTTTGEAVGTIAYMAPEQIRGASLVDERADVYGFAMLVFEALSGRLPYEATGQIAMIASKLERPALHLRDAARVPVPSGLDALVARCLARKPQERYASAKDLLAAWRSLGPASVAPRLPLDETVVDAILPAQRAVSAVGLFPLASLRSSKVGLVAAACALLASSAVIVFALRTRTSLPSPAAPPARGAAGEGTRAPSTAVAPPPRASSEPVVEPPHDPAHATPHEAASADVAAGKVAPAPRAAPLHVKPLRATPRPPPSGGSGARGAPAR